MRRNKELEDLLDDFFSGERCAWCGDNDRKLVGKDIRLCNSCRRIQALVRESERDQDKHPFGVDELEIAKRMEKLAKADGARFGGINTLKIDGVDLEHAFNQVAQLTIHRDLPYNDANAFEEFFTLAQRRFLFYLLSSIIRIDARRHRKMSAAYA